MRASGANVTERHIEDVSLCALFLMEAAKKADIEFELHPRSSKHTTSDAASDIRKVSLHLLENEVTSIKTGRTNPAFRDVTEDGFSKMSQAWLDHLLVPLPNVESTVDSEHQALQEDILDLDYELHHVS